MKQGKAVAGIVDATVPLRDCPSTGLDRGLIWLIPGYPFELGRVDGRRKVDEIYRLLSRVMDLPPAASWLDD
jgi:hypothetical protein